MMRTIMTTVINNIAASMPYRVRLYRYHREKEELFERLNEMTPAEIDEAQRELARKWRI